MKDIVEMSDVIDTDARVFLGIFLEDLLRSEGIEMRGYALDEKQGRVEMRE